MDAIIICVDDTYVSIPIIDIVETRLHGSVIILDKVSIALLNMMFVVFQKTSRNVLEMFFLSFSSEFIYPPVFVLLTYAFIYKVKCVLHVNAFLLIERIKYYNKLSIDYLLY